MLLGLRRIALEILLCVTGLILNNNNAAGLEVGGNLGQERPGSSAFKYKEERPQPNIIFLLADDLGMFKRLKWLLLPDKRLLHFWRPQWCFMEQPQDHFTPLGSSGQRWHDSWAVLCPEVLLSIQSCSNDWLLPNSHWTPGRRNSVQFHGWITN